MDAKELLVYMKQAELQAELVVEAGQQLDRAIKHYMTGLKTGIVSAGLVKICTMPCI
ncbi:hypothetical protein LL060_00855 [Escherichia coli]|nr:hypothetical protein [Escherichia coli]